MLARPVVGVFAGEGAKRETVKLPTVFTTPIRPDLVNKVFCNTKNNRRQAHAVSKYAGKQSSAESWGTGRAVARIPRVAGGGTHRAGQGAFGNMCRGGRRFAPSKVWRRWHRMSNLSARRYAVASAVSASAVPALVMARGHRISQVHEVPLVIDNKIIDSIDKTKNAVALMKSIGAYEDVQKVKDTVQTRAGKGKARNRRFKKRRGPLIVFNEKTALNKAFRGLPGVELVPVTALNILQLAPGGHVGRFIIWTKDAFQQLDNVFGTRVKASTQKIGWRLPHSIVANPNISRVMNSEEIQSVLRPVKTIQKHVRKVNPLAHPRVMEKLNPGSMARRRATILAQQKLQKAKAAAAKKGVKFVNTERKARAVAKRALNKKIVKTRNTFAKSLLAK